MPPSRSSVTMTADPSGLSEYESGPWAGSCSCAETTPKPSMLFQTFGSWLRSKSMPLNDVSVFDAGSNLM